MRVASLAFYKIKQLGHVFLFVFQNPMIAAEIPIYVYGQIERKKKLYARIHLVLHLVCFKRTQPLHLLMNESGKLRVIQRRRRRRG